MSEIDSTNAEAARRAGRGARGTEWILARRQSAGYGRRGRAWATVEGNFAASLLIHPNDPPERLALRSFVAALALDEALTAATGRSERLALKWPNDVLLDGGKVAGILLESSAPGPDAGHLIIGVGVNLVAAPDREAIDVDALTPVSLAALTGVWVTPEAFLDLIAPAYARWEARFCADGFAPIRAAWLARAAHLGEPVTARTGSRTLSGIFETVDETGALVLSTDKGLRLISSADVFFASDAP